MPRRTALTFSVALPDCLVLMRERITQPIPLDLGSGVLVQSGSRDRTGLIGTVMRPVLGRDDVKMHGRQG